MIHIMHLGAGRTYAQEIQNRVKRINARQHCHLQKHPIPVQNAYVVVIDSQGEPITLPMLRQLVKKDQVTFVIGDSDGMPESFKKVAQKTLAVSGIPLSHLTETLILTEALEKAVQPEHE